MIELSAKVEEIVTDILMNYGKDVCDCILTHCLGPFEGKIVIDIDCVENFILLIEEKKQIVLGEKEKIELKKLEQYQEEDLKRWFAGLLGLKLTDAELLRMTVFQILNCKNGSKNAIDEDGEGSLFSGNRSFKIEDDGRGQIKR